MDKRILIGVIVILLIGAGIGAFIILQPEPEQAPVEEAPVEEAPVEEAPVEEAPVEQVPAEQAPVEEAPVEQVPAEQAPVEQVPVEQVPAEQAPVEQVPVEQVPVEQANVILAESLQNTLDLHSFTTTGDGTLKAKCGETILFKVAIEDGQMSVVNPFDVANQNSSSVLTYNILINFEAMADFIEKVQPPEELEEAKAAEEMLGIDILETMRMLGEVNILATIGMKSIDFDTYMKIVEVEGLREMVTNAGGMFLAEMVMGEIEPHLGIWRKTPADPTMVEEMTAMPEKIEGLLSAIFDAQYVKEVLSNTAVNGVPAYNFVRGLDLYEMRNAIISVIPLFAEEAEIDTEEKEEIIADITKYWPEIVEVIEAMEIESRTYICQETRFTIKETMTANINLYQLVAILDPIVREAEEMTPEELVESYRMKEAVKNIRLVITMNSVFSDHNAVPDITPPLEYEIIETPEIFDPPPLP